MSSYAPCGYVGAEPTIKHVFLKKKSLFVKFKTQTVLKVFIFMENGDLQGHRRSPDGILFVLFTC